MHDHGQIELNRQIQLRPEDGELFRQILVSEQIEAKFTNGHHPIIGAGGFAQHIDQNRGRTKFAGCATSPRSDPLYSQPPLRNDTEKLMSVSIHGTFSRSNIDSRLG